MKYIIIISVLLSACSVNTDDSDMPDGRRSGLFVRYDSLTGCQYLESIGGGITPRMNADGKHICKEMK